MEVVYLRGDGTIVRTYAYQSFCVAGGRWMVGDTPLDEIDGRVVYQGGRLSDEKFERIAGTSRRA